MGVFLTLIAPNLRFLAFFSALFSTDKGVLRGGITKNNVLRFVCRIFLITFAQSKN